MNSREYFEKEWHFKNAYKNHYACQNGEFDYRYYCEEGLIENPFMKEHPEYAMKLNTVSIRNLEDLNDLGEDLLTPITDDEVNKMVENASTFYNIVDKYKKYK